MVAAKPSGAWAAQQALLAVLVLMVVPLQPAQPLHVGSSAGPGTVMQHQDDDAGASSSLTGTAVDKRYYPISPEFKQVVSAAQAVAAAAAATGSRNASPRPIAQTKVSTPAAAQTQATPSNNLPASANGTEWWVLWNQSTAC